MGIEFFRPLAWLLLPIGVAAILIIDSFGTFKRRSLKRSLSRAAHLLLILLLVFALSGPTLLLSGTSSATWALVDLSASSAGQRAAMESALKEGLAGAGDDLSTGAIAFGQSAMVDAPLAKSRTGMPLGTSPDASGTDIGHALQMAMALLPDDAAGRIALLSDGRDNADGLDTALGALAARGIAVDVLPFATGFASDAQVTSVTPPALSYEGESFDVTVRIDSSFDSEGTLVLYANREPIATREITLRGGVNTFIFQDKATQSGVTTYEAELIAQGDENPRNNRLGAYMDVRGVPQILIVGDGQELSEMLTASGMHVDRMRPEQLPETAEALRHYHAIALDNVSANDLTDESIQALSDYARKLGRGLAFFGGDNSYALGGWRGSPLEDLLPVTIDVRNQMDMPTLSLILVIDHSGSMSEGRYGITRLDMAKEAAMRSTEVLTARDTIGVIAFDDRAKWVVPMQPVTDIEAVQEMIGTIVPDGGTMFYAPLAQALEAQLAANAQLKHVIFLTDGEAADGGHELLIEEMAKNGITLTTVAVGGGANTTLLKKFAELGKGRAYAAGEFDDLPKIFTKETYLAAESFVQNRRITPVIASDSTLTRFAGFPEVDGYLSTTARPLATLSLVTDRDDPLLAWWQYGAGRVAAWTSDAQGAWTGGFLRWDEAPAFFAGILSHVLPEEAGEGELTLTKQGNTLSLTYAVDDTAQGLKTEATVLAPDGTQQTVTLQMTAPGIYEGWATATQEGAYAVRVEQRMGTALLRTLESGTAVGYSKEYDLRAGDGSALLERIAAETGGRLLTSAADLFTERGTGTRERRDITSWLLLASLLIFLLDVAQRRLAWETALPENRQRKGEAPQRKKQKGPDQKTLRKESEKKVSPTPPPPDTGEKLLAGRKKKLL